jgi:hypothetical protein
MTDPINTETENAEATGPGEAVSGEATEPATRRDTDAGSGEAAKYRRRLREAEAERDALAARLATAQRREVERLAGADLARGDDVWLGGAELAALLDDDGNVDPSKVAETTAVLLSERPHWASRETTADHDQGRRDEGQAAPTFAEFLRGAGE